MDSTSMKEHPQLRAMHDNEERRYKYDSPVALGHPLGELGGADYAKLERRITPDLTNNAIVQQGWTPSSVKEAKPSNPKQAFGDKKPPLHLIHMIAQLHESAALHSGKLKYGCNNYLETRVEAMTYVGAVLRHLGQWVSGERVDQKELVHHLGAIRACTNILLSAEATGMLIDNRPTTGFQDVAIGACRPPSYREATQETFAEVERTIEHLNKLYPEK